MPHLSKTRPISSLTLLFFVCSLFSPYQSLAFEAFLPHPTPRLITPLQLPLSPPNILNKLKTIKDPLDRITAYSYDLNENLQSILDVKGNTTEYEYDERDLLFTITDANSPPGVTQYDYDENGNLEKITDANSNHTTYAYDGFDRLKTTTYADGGFSQFDYDLNSNMIQHITPSTKPIAYECNAPH